MASFRNYEQEAFLSGGVCLRAAVGTDGSKFYIHPDELEHVKARNRNFVRVYNKNGKRKLMPNNKHDFQFRHIENIASIKA